MKKILLIFSSFLLIGCAAEKATLYNVDTGKTLKAEYEATSLDGKEGNFWVYLPSGKKIKWSIYFSFLKW